MEVTVPSRLFTTEEFTFSSPTSSSPDEDSSFEDFESVLADDFFIPPVGLRELQLLKEGIVSPVKTRADPPSSSTSSSYSVSRKTTRELEEAQTALKSANLALKEAKETIEFQRKELNLAKEQYNRCKGEVEDLTIKNASMSKELSTETDLRRANAEKVIRYDSVYNENEFYKKEIESLRTAMTENLNITKVLQANEKLNKSKADIAEKHVEKLMFDKAALQKEFDTVFLSNENMRFLHAESNSRCEELMEKNQELTSIMTGMATNIELQFDEKTKKELESLRKTIITESEQAREVVTTKWESESMALREQILSLKSENSKLRCENISLSEEKQKLTMEHGFQMKASQHKLNDTQETLKNKSLELTSLGATFEERMKQLRRKEIENRMLYDQIDILKAAISKLEIHTGGFYLDLNLKEEVEKTSSTPQVIIEP